MKKTVINSPMKTKSKPIAAAIGLAMGALVSTGAQAVNMSTDSLGEVILFPYYTVNNGYNTNINITNTSENTVVFKIRFREAENSRDARDFNVILSPYDVWTATITASGDAADAPARLITADQSCTAGELLKLTSDSADKRRYIDFTNYDYIGSNKDGGRQGLDRTREGYIEVIQMGHIKPRNPGAPSPQLDFTDAANVGDNAKHKSNGVPKNCDAVRQAFAEANVSATDDEWLEPINVLKASANLINTANGKAITMEPTVLANFYNPAGSGVDGAGPAGQNLITYPESQQPGLADVSPAVAVLNYDNATSGIATSFATEVNAVSALISRNTVANQYSVNPATGAQTDWVITFPTKYYYVDERQGGVGNSSVAPFEQSTTFQNGRGCAGVTVGFRFFDREEDEKIAISTVGFSPAPPEADPDQVCNESQVLTFANSNLLGSAEPANVPVDDAGFTKGWMSLVFPSAGALTSEDNYTFTGYPVIGFSATTLENGTNNAAILNYGFSAQHGYTRNIARN